MPNISLKITLPADIILALNESKDEIIQEMKFYYAIKMFEMKKLSCGKAAQLCDMDKWSFIEALNKLNIPVINYTIEELEKEVALFQKEIMQ